MVLQPAQGRASQPGLLTSSRLPGWEPGSGSGQVSVVTGDRHPICSQKAPSGLSSTKALWVVLLLPFYR